MSEVNENALRDRAYSQVQSAVFGVLFAMTWGRFRVSTPEWTFSDYALDLAGVVVTCFAAQFAMGVVAICIAERRKRKASRIAAKVRA